jgi:heterotetrameric sarcosine oxidase gamma subunit
MADTALPEMAWPAPAAMPGATLNRPAFTARILPPAGATLIGGDLAAALAALAPGAPLVGLGGETGEGAHALRIARDRALLVTTAPLAAPEGWRAGSDRAGWAASAADDAWMAVEIAGAGAADVIAQGTAADLVLGAPSAMTLFAGRPMLLARRGDAFRLQAEAPFREYLWEWLAGAA